MIKPLTSLRFFAAMMVLAHHYFGFRAGFSGVTFFYVLSGYILTRKYGDGLETWSQIRQFWWKRFARIYPTHLLLLLVCLPLGAASAFLPNLLLLHAWVPSQGIYFSFDKPSWSISDEAAFYAVFPWVLMFMTRKWLIAWTALLFFVAVTVSIQEPSWTLDGPLYSLTVHGHTLQAAPALFLFYIFPLMRLFEFAIGIAVARYGPHVTLGNDVEFAAVGVSVASIMLFYTGPSAPFAASILYIPAAALTVYAFSRQSGFLSKMLSHPALVLLGDSSFMLYMVHWPLLQYVQLPPLILAPIAVGLSVALHLWFERPAQRFLLQRRAAAAPLAL